MKRWVIAFALVLSPVLLQPAAAHARAASAESSAATVPAMCSEAAQTVLFAQFAAPDASQLFAPDAPQLTLRTSADASDEGQIAWCVSSDDPRCAPRDAGSPLQTQRSLPQLCDFVSLRTPQPACIETDSVALLARLGAPRAGVSMRLERPPRA